MGNDTDRKSDGGEVTVAFRVTGRVQGVGYRWWSRRLVVDAEASGFIWNHADGSVRLVLRGTPEAISKVRDGLGEGPPGARVDGVIELPTTVTVDIDHVRIGAPRTGG